MATYPHPQGPPAYGSIYGQPPIINPSVPVTVPVEGGIAPGKMVFVQGTAPFGADRFCINLQCGPHNNPDIALHFNPRFGDQQVVRNSRQGNAWGQEERHGGFPFTHGQPFEVIILAEQNCWKVAVNGQHFTEFYHRTSKERVSYLNIEGNVQVSFIRFQGGSASMAYPGAGGGGAQPMYNPPNPLTTVIPGGMYPGRIIQITGVIRPQAKRFQFNLQCGSHNNCDMALHFDCRFHYGNDRNVTVRNHRQGGQFGSEERHQTFFPFVQNGGFELIILCEQNSFKVAVNNQHFTEFYHRIQPLNRIDTLNVNGDANLSLVRIQ